MKPLVLLAALVLCSCSTFYYPNGQKSASIGSNVGTLDIQTPNYHLHVETIDNAAIYDAAGRFIGNIGSAVAEGLIAHGVGIAVTHGAVNGVQLIAATLPVGIQKVASRKTNRATPAPSSTPATRHP